MFDEACRRLGADVIGPADAGRTTDDAGLLWLRQPLASAERVMAPRHLTAGIEHEDGWRPYERAFLHVPGLPSRMLSKTGGPTAVHALDMWA